MSASFLRQLSRQHRSGWSAVSLRVPKCTNRVFSTASSTASNNYDNESADFGFRNVKREDKEKLVREVFSSVANKYDIMNDLMSAGIHRLWKDELIDMFCLPAAAKFDPSYIPRHLDVAGGTGDIAFRSLKEMSKCYGNRLDEANKDVSMESDKQIVVCDINPEMLAVGKQRAPEVLGKTKSQYVGFIEGNAEKLPFADNSFDIYTIAFGLRNVTNKDAALREAYRVLRPQGRLMVLEFSHLTNPLLQFAYDQYSFRVIPEIGKVVTNDRESYQYLVESIRKFPKQVELVQMLHEAGFKCCTYRNLTMGVVAIHSGYKV